jgi:hypothetical protein
MQGLRRSGTKSSPTLRWRELDSNFRFRARFGSVFVVSLFPPLRRGGLIDIAGSPNTESNRCHNSDCRAARNTDRPWRHSDRTLAVANSRPHARPLLPRTPMRSIDEVIAQRTRPGLASSKPCLSLHGDEQRGRFCVSSSGSRASRDRKFESSSLQQRVRNELCAAGGDRVPSVRSPFRRRVYRATAWRCPLAALPTPPAGRSISAHRRPERWSSTVAPPKPC